MMRPFLLFSLRLLLFCQPGQSILCFVQCFASLLACCRGLWSLFSGPELLLSCRATPFLPRGEVLVRSLLTVSAALLLGTDHAVFPLIFGLILPFLELTGRPGVCPGVRLLSRTLAVLCCRVLGSALDAASLPPLLTALCCCGVALFLQRTAELMLVSDLSGRSSLTTGHGAARSESPTIQRTESG